MNPGYWLGDRTQRYGPRRLSGSRIRSLVWSVGDGLKGQVAIFKDQVHGAVKTFLHGDIGLAADAHRLLLLELVETIAVPDREVILDLSLNLDGEDGS